MDNAQRAIMIGVGLFITIIIITAVMAIVNAAQGMIGGATDHLNDLSAQMQNEITAAYDDTIVSGSQVLTAVKRYYDNKDIVVVVDNTVNKDAAEKTVTFSGKEITTSAKTVDLDVDKIGKTYYEIKKDAKISDNAAQPSIGSITSNVQINGKYHAFLIKDGKVVRGMVFARIS